MDQPAHREIERKPAHRERKREVRLAHREREEKLDQPATGTKKKIE